MHRQTRSVSEPLPEPKPSSTTTSPVPTALLLLPPSAALPPMQTWLTNLPLTSLFPPPTVVSTAVPRVDPKRMRMDQMLLGMSGMGLAQGAGSSGGAAPEGKRQRFRLVTTLELKAMQVCLGPGWSGCNPELKDMCPCRCGNA